MSGGLAVRPFKKRDEDKGTEGISLKLKEDKIEALKQALKGSPAKATPSSAPTPPVEKKSPLEGMLRGTPSSDPSAAPQKQAKGDIDLDPNNYDLPHDPKEGQTFLRHKATGRMLTIREAGGIPELAEKANEGMILQNDRRKAGFEKLNK